MADEEGDIEVEVEEPPVERDDESETDTNQEKEEEEEDEKEEEIERLPPPKQKLFMMEFIVDDINLDFCNSQLLTCFGVGKTVIEFKFLDIGPLSITEDDFLPIQKRYLEGCRGTGSIKNGKSLLFGLTEEQAEAAATKTIIYCDFYKMTEKKKYKLGSCIIRLINMFKALMAVVQEGGKTEYHKNVKDFYKIKDSNDDLVGHLYAYIRLSCFNEVIINKFSKDPNAELDYSPEQGFYKYKYNKSKLEASKQICECEDNKSEEKDCKCSEETPHETCPQIYTDNKCIYDCPANLRPCEDCPPTCAANKAAGKKRAKTSRKVDASKSKMSGKSGKSGAGGKDAKGGKGGKTGKKK